MKAPREEVRIKARVRSARSAGGPTASRSAHEWMAEFDAAMHARFAALKAWRSAVARAQNKPAYVIFHDASLAEMALRKPESAEELSHITGVGAHKLEAYGRDLLEVLATT